MTLVRQNTGRLLRGPTGLLTHDLDCCCEQCTDFDIHACGAPTQLTAVIAGCSLGNNPGWGGDHCCMLFDDTYISTAFSFDTETPCTWNLALIVEFQNGTDCDSYPWDTLAYIDITCQVIYDQRLGDVNYKYYVRPRVLIAGEFLESGAPLFRLETSPIAEEWEIDPVTANCASVPSHQMELRDYTGSNTWCIDTTPGGDPYPTIDFTLGF